MLSPLGKRLALAVGLGTIGLATALALPKKPGVGEAGVRLALPADVGSWHGEDAEVSQKEREVLGPDVEFARKMYSNAFGDRVFVSIVLAGFDPTTGIHRPERCLPAQGWNIARSVRAKLPLGEGAQLDTMQLYCFSERQNDKGQRFQVKNFNYYWFVGSRDVTADSLERTIIDIRDRVWRGQNQRWAYVTVAATVTEGLTRFGRSEAETKKIIEEFIPRIVPTFQLVDANDSGPVAD